MTRNAVGVGAGAGAEGEGTGRAKAQPFFNWNIQIVYTDIECRRAKYEAYDAL